MGTIYQKPICDEYPVKFDVYGAVAYCNIGREASVPLFKKLGIIQSKSTLKRCLWINKKRTFLPTEKYGIFQKEQKNNLWKIKQKEYKNEQKDGETHISVAWGPEYDNCGANWDLPSWTTFSLKFLKKFFVKSETTCRCYFTDQNFTGKIILLSQFTSFMTIHRRKDTFNYHKT